MPSCGCFYTPEQSQTLNRLSNCQSHTKSSLPSPSGRCHLRTRNRFDIIGAVNKNILDKFDKHLGPIRLKSRFIDGHVRCVRRFVAQTEARNVISIFDVIVYTEVRICRVSHSAEYWFRSVLISTLLFYLSKLTSISFNNSCYRVSILCPNPTVIFNVIYYQDNFSKSYLCDNPSIRYSSKIVIRIFYSYYKEGSF